MLTNFINQKIKNSNLPNFNKDYIFKYISVRLREPGQKFIVGNIIITHLILYFLNYECNEFKLKNWVYFNQVFVKFNEAKKYILVEGKELRIEIKTESSKSLFKLLSNLNKTQSNNIYLNLLIIYMVRINYQ